MITEGGFSEEDLDGDILEEMKRVADGILEMKIWYSPMIWSVKFKVLLLVSSTSVD